MEYRYGREYCSSATLGKKEDEEIAIGLKFLKGSLKFDRPVYNISELYR